jgi:hypothetical protein
MGSGSSRSAKERAATILAMSLERDGDASPTNTSYISASTSEYQAPGGVSQRIASVICSWGALETGVRSASASPTPERSEQSSHMVVQSSASS